MAFFASGRDAAKTERAGVPSLDLMHRLECKICPLDKIRTNRHPHMEPTGTDKPYVYILGEAPGETEDAEGEQFIGKSGQFLRSQIPGSWKRDLRWNNVVRTRPRNNDTPQYVEIECCRPSLIRDIEDTKPVAIFGFGAVALEWALGQTKINNWRGRRAPVRIGDHECWFYSFHHPSYIERLRSEVEKKRRRTLRYSDIGGEDDRAFRLDLRHAFEELEAGLDTPRVWTPKDALSDLEWVENCDKADLHKIAKFLEWAADQEHVGVDYETKNLRPYEKSSRVLTAAVGTEKRSFSFPFDHPGARWPSDLRAQLQELWIKFLRSPKVRKRVHNLPFELEWTSVMFDEWCLHGTRWDDTMTMAANLDERTGKGEGQKSKEQGPLSLDFLVLQYFGLHLKNISKLDRKNLANEPLRDVLRYNAMDAKFHDMLGDAQYDRIVDEGFEKLYKHDLAALPAFVRTQIKGLPVNQETVERLHRKYRDQIEELDAKIAEFPEVEEFRRRKREKFDPGSTPHVTVLVRDIMKRHEGMQRGPDGEDGRYSVEEDVLKDLGHPLTDAILARRKVWKVKSTYNDGLRWPDGKYMHSDGMLHPVITTTTARTGRTASEDPNEQNWPTRDGEQKEVRSQIEARPDHLFCAFDYGQIQARNIAMESRDKVFCKALWERYDIHMDWTEKLAHAYPSRVGGKQYIKDKKVMKHFRGDVKNKWTFPLFFGSMGESCARDLEIPWEYVKPLYDEFWDTFHGVKDWQDRLLKFYREHGYVEALDGRRRRAPLTQNQVFNSPIQADEACIVKDAQTRLSQTQDWDYQSSLIIHDDLTFEFSRKKLDEHCEFVLDRMLDVSHFDWINVPITIEVKVGKDWQNMKEAGDFSSDTWNR